MARCWPKDPDHIMRLYNIGPKKGVGFLVSGVHRISDLPADQKLNATQKRQIRAMKADRLVVEATLGQALEPFDCKLGFLDFETIMRAVPVWPGMARDSNPHVTAPPAELPPCIPSQNAPASPPHSSDGD